MRVGASDVGSARSCFPHPRARLDGHEVRRKRIDLLDSVVAAAPHAPTTVIPTNEGVDRLVTLEAVTYIHYLLPYTSHLTSYKTRLMHDAFGEFLFYGNAT